MSSAALEIKKVARVRLSCTTTPQVGEAVEQLLWSGLYGNNRAEVISRLIGDGISRAIAAGLVDPKTLREVRR
jgi:hypothetical protein